MYTHTHIYIYLRGVQRSELTERERESGIRANSNVESRFDVLSAVYFLSNWDDKERERERGRERLAAADRFISRPAKVFAYISSNYYGRVSKNYAGPLMDRAVVLPRCFEKFFSADNFSPMGENSLPVPAGRETEGDESFFPPTPVKSLSVVTINNLSRNNNVPPGDSPLPRGEFRFPYPS